MAEIEEKDISEGPHLHMSRLDTGNDCVIVRICSKTVITSGIRTTKSPDANHVFLGHELCMLQSRS